MIHSPYIHDNAWAAFGKWWTTLGVGAVIAGRGVGSVQLELLGVLIALIGLGTVVISNRMVASNIRLAHELKLKELDRRAQLGIDPSKDV